MKLILILLIILNCCGCQLQINIASSVASVDVYKTQISEGDQKMTGSALEDINKGASQATTTDANLTK